MAVELGWLSLTPPIVAIALALWKKRVLLALFSGIALSHVILHLEALHQVPSQIVDHMIGIAVNEGNFRLVLFSLLLGALLRLINDVGGFKAFSSTIAKLRSNFGKGTAYGITYVMGVSLFLETWSNVLINSTTVVALYDRLGISRQRMAYFVHTIGISVVAVVPINGWAAFYMGLLSAQGIANPFNFLLTAIPFIFYSWISLCLVAFVMVTGLTVGPMKRFEELTRQGVNDLREGNLTTGDERESSQHIRLEYMIVPVTTMIITLFFGLYVTGGGSFANGDASKSIVYSVAASIAILSCILLIRRRLTLFEIEKKITDGMAEFFGVAILIIFALSLGDLCQQIGTGPFVAQLTKNAMPTFLLPALVFVLGAAMSFATGTSYGTFSIMVPIALPIAQSVDLSPSLMFGAVISGGLFGDNCSPISDTTIVTSLGANVDIMDHVRSQLPYALIAGLLTTLAFVILGLAM